VPALIAHHIFGQDVLAAMGSELGLSEESREAFLLGCQGPDPFFYTVFSRKLIQRHRFGSSLHKERVAASLDCLRKAARVFPESRHQAMESYVRGWLCHFTLDSMAHPLIFWYEQSITGAGVPGLGLEAKREVHAQVEADLDCMMLFSRSGQTIRSFRPVSEILHASDRLLDWIGVMYRRVSDEVYGHRLSAAAFKRGVRDMRSSYRLIYSPYGAKRVILGRIERLFRPHSFIQAYSHRLLATTTCDYDNHEHLLWTNPFTGEKSTASFMDLYNEAIALSQQRMRWYAEAVASKQLVGSLNFDGRPIE